MNYSEYALDISDEERQEAEKHRAFDASPEGLESHNSTASWTPACLLCGEYCSPDAMFHGLCPDCTAPHISHAEAA